MPITKIGLRVAARRPISSIEVLWAVRDPKWEVVTDWASLPDRGIPDDQGGHDDEPGWITAIRVDGLTFYGHDHYSVSDKFVQVWSDDPDDPPYEPGLVRIYHRNFHGRTTVGVPLRDPVRHGVWLEDDEWYRVKAELIPNGCACRGMG